MKKGKPKLPLSNLYAILLRRADLLNEQVDERLLLLGLGDGILQVLTSLERRNGLCGRLDSLPGLRIHARCRLALARFEFSEPSDDHRFVLLQRCCNHFHHTVQCCSSILLGESRFLREFLDEFCLVHVYPLGL
jgi:hypothetical protein